MTSSDPKRLTRYSQPLYNCFMMEPEGNPGGVLAERRDAWCRAKDVARLEDEHAALLEALRAEEAWRELPAPNINPRDPGYDSAHKEWSDELDRLYAEANRLRAAALAKVEDPDGVE